MQLVESERAGTEALAGRHPLESPGLPLHLGLPAPVGEHWALPGVACGVGIRLHAAGWTLHRAGHP